MRDPERLNWFYAELKKIHQDRFPDWRFGQFMSNFLGWLWAEHKVDSFFPEENKMLEYIREYADFESRYKK